MSAILNVLTQTRKGIALCADLGIAPSDIKVSTPIDALVLFMTLECGLPILDVFFMGLIGIPADLVLRALDDAILMHGVDPTLALGS